jgi:hypothetical protein
MIGSLVGRAGAVDGRHGRTVPDRSFARINWLSCVSLALDPLDTVRGGSRTRRRRVTVMGDRLLGLRTVAGLSRATVTVRTGGAVCSDGRDIVVVALVGPRRWLSVAGSLSFVFGPCTGNADGASGHSRSTTGSTTMLIS